MQAPQGAQLTGTNRPRAWLTPADCSCIAFTVRFPGYGRNVSPYNSIRFPAAIAKGKHPVPFRTRKLSSSAPMVLRGRPRGRAGHRRNTLRKDGPDPAGAGPSLAVYLTRSGLMAVHGAGGVPPRRSSWLTKRAPKARGRTHRRPAHRLSHRVKSKRAARNSARILLPGVQCQGFRRSRVAWSLWRRPSGGGSGEPGRAGLACLVPGRVAQRIG